MIGRIVPLRRRIVPLRRRIVPALALAGGLIVVLPGIVLAHPLGNFTVNHYAGIRVEPDRIVVDLVIDEAEIPTFQDRLRIDTDGDGVISDDEANVERLAACPGLIPEPCPRGRRPAARPGGLRSRPELPAGDGRPEHDAPRLRVQR